jgi:VanZ family protein
MTMRRSEPTSATALRRLLLATGLTLVLVMLFGPFHSPETWTVAPDKLHHTLLFYSVSLAVMTVLPRSGSLYAALGIMLFAAASELVQRYVGRECSLTDLTANLFGVSLAFAPRMIARRPLEDAAVEVSRATAPAHG